MLTIRKDQMAAFKAVRLEDFISTVVEHLNKKFPDKVIKDKEMFRLDCKEGVKRARSYDIATKDDLISYMEIRLQCGSDFDQEPWAHNILTNPSLFPFEKISVLEEACMINLMNKTS